MNYNLFFDESCHLENDISSVMTIGYIKVPEKGYEELYENFKKLLFKHKSLAEIKWNKFSASRIPLYMDLIDFFFENPVHFRCMIVKYKDQLNHDDYNSGSHDNFYYKMVYFLLRPNPQGSNYKVFLDVKDTRGSEKLNKIKKIFSHYHLGESPFIHFQHIRSDNLFIQLSDFLIGAVTYKCRVLNKEFEMNSHRKIIIDYLEEKAGYYLNEGTPVWETKFNIFDHQPKKKRS